MLRRPAHRLGVVVRKVVLKFLFSRAPILRNITKSSALNYFYVPAVSKLTRAPGAVRDKVYNTHAMLPMLQASIRTRLLSGGLYACLAT